MLLLSLCLAAAVVRSHGESPAERLYGAPATFWDHLPIVELNVRGSGTLKFLIDSGANRSVLFPPSGGVPEGTELHAGKVDLGACDFARITSRDMTADGARLMNRLGVSGALGDDFLLTHDVLIDYKRRRIYVSSGSPPDDPQRLVLSWLSKPPETVRLDGARSIDLVEQDERYFAPATVSDTACLMALDTGTGESALPLEIASGLPKTGVTKILAGFQGKTVRAAEHVSKIAVGDNPPIAVRVLASDQRGPILGGNAFDGRCLFLQLRNSKASYW